VKCKKYFLRLCIYLICIVSCSAYGEKIEPRNVSFTDGYRIGIACTSSNIEVLINECMPYISGVQDTVATLKAMGVLDKSAAPFCLPKNTALKDLIQVVSNYYKTKDIESQKKVYGPINVLVALVKAYPCESE
jgi:hypothetical protein